MKPRTVPKYNQKENEKTESYQKQLHAKRTDSKLKKIKQRTSQDSLTISTVPYPLQQSQRKKEKICTVPPPAPR